MELNAIRSFVLVAEEGNLTRAAARRHTTPSAVSAHLRQLEDRLGVVLFERSRRGMRLTHEGEQLLEPARRVIAAGRGLLEAAGALHGDPVRTVRLGLNGPPEHLRIGPLMAAAARGEPPLAVELVTSMSERIREDVCSGRLDAGFVFGPADRDVLVRYSVARRHLRVVVPGSSAIEALPEAAAERARLPWIYPTAACPFLAVMDEILGPAAADVHIVTRADGEESIRALVRAGMGVGLLEERYAREGAADGGLRLLEPSWGIDLGLVHRRDRRDDPAIVALLEALLPLWASAETAVA